MYLTASEAVASGKGNSLTNQKIKDRFVDLHVKACVTQMMDYCIKKGWEDENELFYFPDFDNAVSYPQWDAELTVHELSFNMLSFGGGSLAKKEEFEKNFDELIEESDTSCMDGKITQFAHEQNVAAIETARGGFEEKMNDTEYAEVYEWWVVSSFLYAKLKEAGHVTLDAGACYVWGRPTTGQGIVLDGVISRICADMEILEGQSNQWKA